MSAKLPRSELHTVTVYKLTTGCLLTKKIWQNLKNAVEDDDAAQVRAILDQEPYLVNRLVHDKENHYSFLYLAAQNGSVEIAKALIAANAYVNQQCSGRCGTPLSIASHNGHKKFVQLLLSQQEIVVDMWSDKRYTPLHQAATNGHTSIVRRLLCANASVDHVNDYGDTGLVAAARKGHLAACQQLLKHKAAVNHQNGRGFSSLYLAAKHGNEALVSALLEANAIVDVACRERMAPLRLAVSNGHLAAVQRLIAAGADINHRDSLLYTALHEAARCDSENGAAIVEDLLHAQADPNAALEDGATPLLFAGSYGHTDRIPLLLHARADINSADLEGNTALVGAASKCRVEAAKLLLDQGADRMKKGKYSARQQARGRAGGIEALFNCTLCGWEGMCCSDCRQKYCRFECDKFSDSRNESLPTNVDCRLHQKIAHQSVLEWALAMSALRLPPYVLEHIFDCLDFHYAKPVAGDYQEQVGVQRVAITGVEHPLVPINENFVHLIVAERTHHENIKMLVSVHQALQQSKASKVEEKLQ